MNEHDYNPADHYWIRADGRIYSSVRREYVDGSDADYLAWREAGNVATPFPVGPDREESEDALREVLASYGLAMFDSDVTPADRRRAAYVAEADPIKDEAYNYQTEADALREAGDEEAAGAAEEKARELRAQYLAVKQEIRERYPDDPAAIE